MNMQKLNLGMQIAVWFTIIILLLTIALTFGVLQVGQSSIEGNIEASLETIANEEGKRVGEFIDNEVALLNIGITQTHEFRDDATEANALYVNQTDDEIMAQLLARDEAWRADASVSNPLVSDILTQHLSESLQDYSENFPTQVEVFMTDRYGALIGTNNITSDYYQADEEWWQVAWNDGLGGVFVGGIDLDESAGVISVDIALPIHDDETGDVIGVMKSVYNVAGLVAELEAFSFGETGRVYLIDSQGKFLDFANIAAPAEFLQDGLIYRESGVDFDLPQQANKPKTIISFAPTQSDALQIVGSQWAIVVEQDRSEAFAPIDELRNTVLIIALVGFGIALLLAFFIGQSLTRDITQLTQTAKQFGQGNFEARVDSIGSREIVELSTSFNAMANQIDQTIADLKIREKEASEAQQQAEDANRAKSSFLANMSHELRTPLNAIINFTKFVAKEDLGELNEEQKETLFEVVDSGKHLLGLINDVLDMSKIEANSLNLFVTDKVNIHEILSYIVSTGKSLAESKPIDIRPVLDTNIPLIRADKQRVSQIFLNIMSNAVKFTSTGHIEVRANQNEHEIIIAIEDTGSGISQDHLQDVFEPFKQTDSGLRQGGGTGLGMPISKKLTEIHGGRLWLESEVGKGSTFYVALPIKSELLTPVTASKVSI